MNKLEFEDYIHNLKKAGLTHDEVMTILAMRPERVTNNHTYGKLCVVKYLDTNHIMFYFKNSYGKRSMNYYLIECQNIVDKIINYINKNHLWTITIN